MRERGFTAAVAVVTTILAAAPFVAAQQGAAPAARRPGQETLYVETTSVAPVRVQLPEGYDATKSYPLVVGLHGHGGRGDDFFIPAPLFDAAGIIYAVAQGPYAFPTAGRIGYSWNLRDVDNEAGDQGELDLSIELVLDVVDALRARYTTSAIYLMGFSQGGTVTYLTAIAHPDRFTGFAVFGSSLTREWFNEQQLAAARRLRVFIGNGRSDPAARRSAMSRDTLDELGYDVTFFDYEGGHIISRSAIDALVEWIGTAERREPPDPKGRGATSHGGS